MNKDSFAHTPVLCVVQKACNICKGEPDKTCKKCNQKEFIFRGEDCLKNLCDWLFSGENKNAIVIAHNMKAFDGQFVLQYMHSNAIKPTIIPKGLELMVIEGGGIRIIHSFNFLPMPLSQLPKAFGFTELKKGYFPHIYNTRENQNYVGALPPAESYGTKDMKPDDYKSFTAWYDEHKNNMFDMQAEMLAYCRSDVDILRKCCMKFRELFIEQTLTLSQKISQSSVLVAVFTGKTICLKKA